MTEEEKRQRQLNDDSWAKLSLTDSDCVVCAEPIVDLSEHRLRPGEAPRFGGPPQGYTVHTYYCYGCGLRYEHLPLPRLKDK